MGLRGEFQNCGAKREGIGEEFERESPGSARKTRADFMYKCRGKVGGRFPLRFRLSPGAKMARAEVFGDGNEGVPRAGSAPATERILKFEAREEGE